MKKQTSKKTKQKNTKTKPLKTDVQPPVTVKYMNETDKETVF